ncbi:MAG: hypothetical protein PVI81_06730 [Anaerolineales bacterium]|jgi:hypothetical protein
MGQIPTILLASVPHVDFGIFNLAWPNIVVWAGLLMVLLAATWLRLPLMFEPIRRDEVRE